MRAHDRPTIISEEEPDGYFEFTARGAVLIDRRGRVRKILILATGIDDLAIEQMSIRCTDRVWLS